MLRVDLHTHSNFSDGTVSPQELVLAAKARKIVVLSLADHDSVDGVPLFLSACRKHGVRGVAGIELSAEHERTLHILGYRFDVDKIARSGALKKIREGRANRNVEICQKLQKLGLDISIEEVVSLGGGVGVVTRPHIARLLVRKGYAKSIADAFVKYLVMGAPAYCERYQPSPENCISLIRDAGGLPVLAHPRQTAKNIGISGLEPLVSRLKDSGLWGIECYTSNNSPADTFESLKLAGEIGLYPTGGSDFHGGNRPETQIGIGVPEDMLPWARFCGGLL